MRAPSAPALTLWLSAAATACVKDAARGADAGTAHAASSDAGSRIGRLPVRPEYASLLPDAPEGTVACHALEGA